VIVDLMSRQQKCVRLRLTVKRKHRPMKVATLARAWIDRSEFAVFHRLATVATTKNLRSPSSLNGLAVKRKYISNPIRKPGNAIAYNRFGFR
jgi:hypothetical protein